MLLVLQPTPAELGVLHYMPSTQSSASRRTPRAITLCHPMASKVLRRLATRGAPFVASGLSPCRAAPWACGFSSGSSSGKELEPQEADSDPELLQVGRHYPAPAGGGAAAMPLQCVQLIDLVSELHKPTIEMIRRSMRECRFVSAEVAAHVDSGGCSLACTG